MTTRTYTPRQSEIERRWFVVDASGQTLGRLATQVAGLLAGKHKPLYASHLDTGDHVIVINAARVAVKGDKLNAKVYARHSGYPGGFRSETLAELLARRPEEVVRRAVKGMLPRNRLGAQQLRKLKVYAAAEHPHEAQQPAAVADASNPMIAAATLAGRAESVTVRRERVTARAEAHAAAGASAAAEASAVATSSEAPESTPETLQTETAASGDAGDDASGETNA
jgi:large subunit ribosomal protein L13